MPEIHQESHCTNATSSHSTNWFFQTRRVLGCLITTTRSAVSMLKVDISGKVRSPTRRFKASPGRNKHDKESHVARAQRIQIFLSEPCSCALLFNIITNKHSKRYRVIGTLVFVGIKAFHPFTASHEPFKRPPWIRNFRWIDNKPSTTLCNCSPLSKALCTVFSNMRSNSLTFLHLLTIHPASPANPSNQLPESRKLCR